MRSYLHEKQKSSLYLLGLSPPSEGGQRQPTKEDFSMEECLLLSRTGITYNVHGVCTVMWKMKHKVRHTGKPNFKYMLMGYQLARSVREISGRCGRQHNENISLASWQHIQDY